MGSHACVGEPAWPSGGGHLGVSHLAHGRSLPSNIFSLQGPDVRAQPRGGCPGPPRSPGRTRAARAPSKPVSGSPWPRGQRQHDHPTRAPPSSRPEVAQSRGWERGHTVTGLPPIERELGRPASRASACRIFGFRGGSRGEPITMQSRKRGPPQAATRANRGPESGRPEHIQIKSTPWFHPAPLLKRGKKNRQRKHRPTPISAPATPPSGPATNRAAAPR